MKQKLAGFIMITLICSFALSQVSNEPVTRARQIEQSLNHLRVKLDEAILRGDIEIVDKCVSEDYLGTDSHGSTITKTELRSFVSEIASLPPSVRPSPSIITKDVRTRVYGDTAVVIGVVTAKSELFTYQAFVDRRPPIDIVNRTRFTDVYVKLKGGWQLVASHTTSLKDTSGK